MISPAQKAPAAWASQSGDIEYDEQPQRHDAGGPPGASWDTDQAPCLGRRCEPTPSKESHEANDEDGLFCMDAE
jgi:hypothetical protein